MQKLKIQYYYNIYIILLLLLLLKYALSCILETDIILAVQVIVGHNFNFVDLVLLCLLICFKILICT